MLAAADILAALDDADLFAPHFKGESWVAWRAFLKALFGLPLSEPEAVIYRACTARTEPPLAAFTEAALIVGRRGGKSRVLALIAVFLATMRDYEPYLAPGEVATVGILAANRSQARSIFRYVSGLLKAVPLLAPMIKDDSNEAIELTNRVVIEISTASFRTARGYSFAAVLADEVAFWRSEESSANPDTEIMRALRPGLASIPGAMLLLASSPYAKKGELYNAYRRHHGKDAARVLVWKADTATMNPRIDPAIIREAYDDDPEAARAEYGAEFRDDLADFITREAIDAITAWGRRELPPEPGVAYSAFVDPSGGASDAMTLAVAHLDNDLGVLDALLEIRPPFDPDVAVAECAALLKRFGISRIQGDRYAGQWPVARFAQHGITFEQCARPKSDLYHDFLPLANARRVELLENPRLSAQLVGLERRTARSGKDSIDHSPGGHDDLANAVCGVLVGMDLDRRPALVRQADLLESAEPLPLHRARIVYATLWVSMDGMAAWAIFAFADYRAPLCVLDFDAVPWSAAVLPDLSRRLDQHAEAAIAGNLNRTVDVALDAPEQFCNAATQTMLAAFAPRLERSDINRRKIGVYPIDAMQLADPARLILNASALVSSGRVKLGPDAAARAATKPLLGTLALRPGEPVDGDPLRVAVLLGIAQIDAAPSPQQGAARIAFG